jgi:hypothetical protein
MRDVVFSCMTSTLREIFWALASFFSRNDTTLIALIRSTIYRFDHKRIELKTFVLRRADIVFIASFVLDINKYLKNILIENQGRIRERLFSLFNLLLIQRPNLFQNKITCFFSDHRTSVTAIYRVIYFNMCSVEELNSFILKTSKLLLNFLNYLVSALTVYYPLASSSLSYAYDFCCVIKVFILYLRSELLDEKLRNGNWGRE